MTKKLLLKDGLRIGKTELTLMQDAALENNAEILDAVTGTLPAVLTTRSTVGTLGPELRAAASGSTGGLTVQPGTAVFRNGSTCTLEAVANLQVGANVSGFKVIMTATEISTGPGVFNMAADRQTLTYVPVSGSTLIATDLYAPNDYIRLTKGLTVYGTYRVASVDAETVVLTGPVTSAAGAVTGLVHAPSGRFFPGYPLAGVTTETVARYAGVVSIKNTSYELTSADILLALVSRGATGAASVTDARTPLVPNIDALVIDNSKVAENAGIVESKLALSEELLTAKAQAHAQNTDTHTTATAFYVRGAPGAGGIRVLTTEDRVTIPSGAPSAPSGTGGSGSPSSDPPASPSVVTASITPSTGSIGVGGTIQLNGNYTGPAGVTVTQTWSSSDPTKATVNTSGLVTGVATGNATITYTAQSAGNQTYTGASRSATATITVTNNAGGTVLTSLSTGVPNNSLALQVGGSTYQINPVATAPTGVTPAPTYTYTTSDATKVTVSASGLVRGVATGTATITIRAQQAGATVGSTTYAAADLTATVAVTVTENIVLKAEPNFRLTFTKVTTTVGGSVWEGMARWGIRGTAGSPVDQNDTWRVTVSSHDVVRGFSADSLRDCVLVDSSNRAFRIVANDAGTASSAVAFGVSLAKGTTPPAAGLCRIRAQATAVGLFVYRSTNGTTESVPFLSYESANVTEMYQPLGASGIPGSTYYFKLISQNSAATPDPVFVDSFTAWGSADAAPPTVNVGTITATPSTTGVRFTWGAPDYYNKDTMDYLCAIQVEGTPLTPTFDTRAVETPTGVGNLASGSLLFQGTPGEMVKINVRVVDGAGQSLSTTTATAQARILTPTTGVTLPYEFPFSDLTEQDFSLTGQLSVGNSQFTCLLTNTLKNFDRHNVAGVDIILTKLQRSNSRIGVKVGVFLVGNINSTVYSSYTFNTAPFFDPDVRFSSPLEAGQVLGVFLESTDLEVDDTLTISGTVKVYIRTGSELRL